MCSKLTVKTPKRRQCRSGVFIVNFEHISYLFLAFQLLTLNRYVCWIDLQSKSTDLRISGDRTSRTSKMESFVTIITNKNNDNNNIVAEFSIFKVCWGPTYASEHIQALRGSHYPVMYYESEYRKLR